MKKYDLLSDTFDIWKGIYPGCRTETSCPAGSGKSQVSCRKGEWKCLLYPLSLWYSSLFALLVSSGNDHHARVLLLFLNVEVKVPPYPRREDGRLQSIFCPLKHVLHQVIFVVSNEVFEVLQFSFFLVRTSPIRKSISHCSLSHEPCTFIEIFPSILFRNLVVHKKYFKQWNSTSFYTVE